MLKNTILCTSLVGLWSMLGCATKYSMTLTKTDNFSGKVSLPDGPADRLIVRVDNAENSWLHLRWADAKIIGLTGFAVPVKTQPHNPVTALPPRSSVEYHLFPAHDYWPEGYYQNRRDGFATLLVYDSDYDRFKGSKSPDLDLYLPTCRGGPSQCSNDDDQTAWTMAHIHGTIRREAQ